jgi:hypothetical protein
MKVIYNSGFKLKPRTFPFGWILDKFWPRYEPDGTASGFVVVMQDGTVVRSKDGTTWGKL